MASPSSPSGSDTPRPSVDEAARALHSIEQGRTRARESATHARWVYVLMGALLFADIAARDFFGRAAVSWVSTGFGVLVLLYFALGRTRRGSTALGQPVRPRRQEITPVFRRSARLAILGVVAAGLVVILLQPNWHLGVPYWRTGVGALVGIALAVFGPGWQRMLLATATGGLRAGESTLDGAR